MTQSWKLRKEEGAKCGSEKPLQTVRLTESGQKNWDSGSKRTQTSGGRSDRHGGKQRTSEERDGNRSRKNPNPILRLRLVPSQRGIRQTRREESHRDRRQARKAKEVLQKGVKVIEGEQMGLVILSQSMRLST